MMSYKTLHDLPTKWKDAWPEKSAVKDIFSSHHNALNCLHYADYESRESILQDLIQATEHGGKHMNALQLDMIWPNPEELRIYKLVYPQVKLILQVGPEAFKSVNTPTKLIAKLSNYNVDYVLLDTSGGRGLELDVEWLRPYIRTIKMLLPEVNIAIAGGLGPDTVSKIAPLVKEFPSLSIDAQSKLRPSGDSHDPIDWELAEYYVNHALHIFGS